jgi:peptidoglycan/LPS O-acetylase OafA/YrhL
MLHYPFIWLFLSYIEREKPAFYIQVLWIPLGTLLLLVLAYLMLRWVDAPLRAYLRQRLRAG